MPAITIEQALQMATLQFRAGRLAEAEATYRKVLAAQPDHAEAWLRLGDVCSRLGRAEEATACAQTAARIPLSSVSACVTLGNALMEKGRLAEAVTAFEQGLKIEPDRPEIHYNLGNAHVKRGQWDHAIACFHRALALRPDYEKAHSNLGLALLEEHRLDEALAHFEQLSEGSARHYNIGVVLSRRGRCDEAVASYRRALDLQPDDANTTWALTAELLLMERYEEGWQMLVRHNATTERRAARRRFQASRWEGSPMNGGTLLIYEEQGIGDAIQFLRYLPLVRERLGSGRIIVECPAPLSRLVRQNGGFGCEWIDQGRSAPLPPYDRQISFFELPSALQCWEPVSMAAPYLHAAVASSTTPFLRVGLVWAGNPNHKTDRHRSISAERLLPLLRVPGATFHSLQINPPGGPPSALLNAGLIDRTATMADFADTADRVAELDLVISVDTSVAHLAGALGRPVWTLLPFAPDWRWGRQRAQTSWYPTMRLFRQPAPGDWDSVIRRVTEETTALASRHS